MKTSINLISIILLVLFTWRCGQKEDDVSPANVDTEGPRVVSISPQSGSLNVAVDASIRITFNEDIDANSVDASSFRMNASGSSANIAGAISVSGRILTFDPNEDLEYATLYTIFVSVGIVDNVGNALQSSFSASLTTAEAPDTEAPSVVSISLTNGAENVAVSERITITFSEPMNQSSLDGNITLRHQIRNEQAALDFEINGNDVIVSSNVDLRGSSQYNFDITTGVTDLAGNQLDFARARVFFTENVPFDVSDISHENDATEVEITDNIITVTFSSEIDASTVGVTNIGLLDESNSIVPGSFQTNGSQVLFTASEPLTEFNHQYTFVIDNGLKDEDGNSFAHSVLNYSFTTVTVSEHFYYYIRNANNPNSWTLIYNIAGDYVFRGNSVDGVSQQMWRFDKGGDKYAIHNRYVGDGRALEATTPGDGNIVFLDARPTSTSYYEGQRWTLTDLTGFYALTSDNGNGDARLDGTTLDTEYGGISVTKMWRFERASEI